MANGTIELVESIPRFASKEDEIYVRLGCAGCVNAVQLRIEGLPSSAVQETVEDIPHTRVSASYRAANADVTCRDYSNCAFENEINRIKSTLLEGADR